MWPANNLIGRQEAVQGPEGGLAEGVIRPCAVARTTLRHVAPSGSEHVDRRETRLLRDAVPKVNRKADIAGPKRIPSTANGHLGAAILDDGRHGKLARAVEPDRVVRAAIEFQERVAIPTG